jgi:hypothetical protein
VLTVYNEQERLSQKRKPLVTQRICKRTYGELEDEVSNKSKYVQDEFKDYGGMESSELAKVRTQDL